MTFARKVSLLIQSCAISYHARISQDFRLIRDFPHHFFSSFSLPKQAPFLSVSIRGWYLSTLVVITDTDAALTRETVGPEATEVDVSLWHAGVGEKKPCTEDWLREDVQNSVGDNLLVDVQVAAAISNSPDAKLH